MENSPGKQAKRVRVVLSRHRESPWLEAELCGFIGFCFVSLQKEQRGSEAMGFSLDTNDLFNCFEIMFYKTMQAIS